MSSPLLDPLWKELTGFISSHLDRNTPLIAPREMIPEFPKVLPYELSGSALGLFSKYQGAAFHKGLLHEASLELLTRVAAEWRPAFANGVFVFFVPADSPLPTVDSPHNAAFFENLELIRINNRNFSPRSSKTVFLISATREPSFLDATLGSLTGFGRSICVADGSKNPAFSSAYDAICLRHSGACIIHLVTDGINDWLSREKPDWISFFQDGALARPDLLVALHHFQHPESHPALSGHRDPDCAEESVMVRDGYRLASVPHFSKAHLHLHRRHWEKDPSLFFDKKEFRLKQTWFPWQEKTLPLRVVSGLVTLKG